MIDQSHFSQRQYFLHQMEKLYDTSREDTQREAVTGAYKIEHKLGGYILIKPECRRTKSGIIEISCLPEGFRLSSLYG